VQPTPHPLLMAAQPRRDRRHRLPLPAQCDDLRPFDPVRGRMPGPRQLPDLLVLLSVPRRTRHKDLRHRTRPPNTTHRRGSPPSSHYPPKQGRSTRAATCRR
jgi:hypothetical protein